MPDANKENTLNQLVGAAFGAAGQRCMALSTAILVGEAKKWLPELVERAKNLRVNAGKQLAAEQLQTWLSGTKFLDVALALLEGNSYVPTVTSPKFYLPFKLISVVTFYDKILRHLLLLGL